MRQTRRLCVFFSVNSAFCGGFFLLFNMFRNHPQVPRRSASFLPILGLSFTWQEALIPSMKEFHTFSWWPLIPFRLQCHPGNCPMKGLFSGRRLSILLRFTFPLGKKDCPPPPDWWRFLHGAWRGELMYSWLHLKASGWESRLSFSSDCLAFAQKF